MCNKVAKINLVMTLTYILLASTSMSLIALLSALALSWRVRFTNRVLPLLVALAAGTMLSAAFLHLLPESFEHLPPQTALTVTLISFVAFFLLEKIFHWRHCHEIECADHQFAYINLIGDALHNFVDGMVIAAAFIVDPWLGLTTTLALALHEIPQEMGDFGVLLLSGFTPKKAVWSNLFVSLTSLVGALAGYLFHLELATSTIYLLPIAAGNFLYLAASDLIPEIRNDHHRSRSVVVFLMFLVGICLIPLLGYYLPEH